MVHENIAVQGINKANIRQIWHLEILPLLNAAIDRRDYMPGDVLNELLEGRLQLWAGLANGRMVAALTTKITVYPAGKTLVLVHLGGEWKPAFKNYLPVLQDFGRSNGANMMRIDGRKGWVRVLKEHFEEVATMMECRL